MEKAKKKIKFDPDTIKIKDEVISHILNSLKKKKIDKTLSLELDGLLRVAKDNKTGATKIPYGKNGPEDLLRIGLLLSKTQSFKDRVREINLDFLEVKSELGKLRNRAARHIKNKYSKDLSELKPVSRQENFVDSVLEEVDDMLEDISLIELKAEEVMKNLVDTYFTLREVKDIAIAFFPEHKSLNRSRQL